MALAELPTELIVAVLARLPPADRARMRRLCRAWAAAADLPGLWPEFGHHLSPAIASFSRACEGAGLSAVRWLAGKMAPGAWTLRHALLKACMGGRLETAQ